MELQPYLLLLHTPLGGTAPQHAQHGLWIGVLCEGLRGIPHRDPAASSNASMHEVDTRRRQAPSVEQEGAVAPYVPTEERVGARIARSRRDMVSCP
jgi:hypothetical protein